MTRSDRGVIEGGQVDVLCFRFGGIPSWTKFPVEGVSSGGVSPEVAWMPGTITKVFDGCAVALVVQPNGDVREYAISMSDRDRTWRTA